MTPKGNAGNGGGCAAIVGLTVLVLTPADPCKGRAVAWMAQFLPFHRSARDRGSPAPVTYSPAAVQAAGDAARVGDQGKEGDAPGDCPP